jgi:hypothetical protein
MKGRDQKLGDVSLRPKITSKEEESTSSKASRNHREFMARRFETRPFKTAHPYQNHLLTARVVNKSCRTIKTVATPPMRWHCEYGLESISVGTYAFQTLIYSSKCDPEMQCVSHLSHPVDRGALSNCLKATSAE